MTPVQLPEVPEEAAGYGTGRNVELEFGQPLYTAAQLREYATAAVRQSANAIFAEGWYLACDWASRDDMKFDVDSPAYEADRAARLGWMTTPSETNSER